MKERIALVGLGQMGLPIAARLATTYEVIAFDISPIRCELAEQHEHITTTTCLTELAGVKTVVLSLPNPKICHEVVAELSPHLAPGTVVIETSTVLPGDVRQCETILSRRGVSLIDAAILSGVKQMEAGNATLLVSGEESDIDRVATVLDILGGAGVQRFGKLGSGMAAKVVNNAVAHAVMVVLVEGFSMAQAEDVDLSLIAEMLNREDGGLQRPLNHRIMQRIADGDYEGGMSLEAARKDSTLALAMAQRSQVPLFATQAAQSVYDIAACSGLERLDYSAVARLWEHWTGCELSYGVSVLEGS